MKISTAPVRRLLFLFTVLLVKPIAAADSIGPENLPPGEKRPNIIYIMLDDAGYADFGAMGSREIRTPPPPQGQNAYHCLTGFGLLFRCG